MELNYTTKLKNKRVISVIGDESQSFLNNIITNDVKKIKFEKAIYSCLLSPQGKVVNHFFVTKIQRQFLIIIDHFLVKEFIDKLNFYKLRSKINIKVENEFDVLFTLNNELKFNSLVKFEDPRIKNFGRYVIVNKNNESKNIFKNEEIYYQNIDTKCLIDNIFNNIKGLYFSLELNMRELHAIDFSKGCFVGQENTARMNIKNKISKRAFLLNKNTNIKINEDLFFENEIIGKVISNTPAFAMIKMLNFDKFFNKKIKTSSNIEVSILKPDWM